MVRHATGCKTRTLYAVQIDWPTVGLRLFSGVSVDLAAPEIKDGHKQKKKIKIPGGYCCRFLFVFIRFYRFVFFRFRFADKTQLNVLWAKDGKSLKVNAILYVVNIIISVRCEL